MTFYGPWIQNPDYDGLGDGSHLFLPNNAVDFSGPPGGVAAPPDAGSFLTTWQGAEASSHHVTTGGGYIATYVGIDVDTSVFPTGPTTYAGYHGLDPLVFRPDAGSTYYPSTFVPSVPPGWDGYEWEDGVGVSTIVDAILEEIYVNDRLTSLLASVSYNQLIYATTDYAPVIPPSLPEPDLATVALDLKFSRSVAIIANSGDHQEHVGVSLFDYITDVYGTIVIANSLETSSAVMAALVEGVYQWGSFIAAASAPDQTYLRYVLRPPRYRFFRNATVIPPRRQYPRQDGLGIGIGRTWPPPNTPQAGRGIGPASPY